MLSCLKYIKKAAGMNSPLNLKLDTNAIHLWRAALTISPEQENTYFELLNADEKARAERFRFPRHKRRFIGARALLRSILGLYLNCPPAALDFEYNDHGKPTLTDGGIEFNLSHSEEMAVYAIRKDFPVGVDIEISKPEFNAGIAEHYFHLDECKLLFSLAPELQPACFYRLWARKEALIKARGDGLHTLLSGFSALPDASTNRKLGDGWFIQDFTASEGFQSAFATKGPDVEISYYEWTEAGPSAVKCLF
jgi:4'-phosphopantetheinyl transferase